MIDKGDKDSDDITECWLGVMYFLGQIKGQRKKNKR